MAITYRFPVLLWRNHHNWWTASLLEWEEEAGTGRTASIALKQLQELLQYQYEQQYWLGEPDFHDAEIVQHTVAIRPEYTVDGRRFPLDETVSLRVHCVRGRQQHGLFICVIPVLNVRFYFYEEKALKKLIPHYVRQHLEEVTPRELSRFLPPPHVQLEQVAVTLKDRRNRQRAWEPDLDTLTSIAEPLGDPRSRRKLSRPWERDKEVADVVQRCQKEKVNLIVVAESGGGKTTVLSEAIRQLERQRLPDEERDDRAVKHRYWLTSAGRLIAGMKYLGQWEERCEAMIAELAQIKGVLCVENLLDLIREGGEGPNDSLASFFLPYLQRGELRMIGEATPDELDACRRLLPGFAEVFQILKLEPFTREQAISALQSHANTLSQNLHVEVEAGVVELVYHLFKRFVPYQAFPGRSVAFVSKVVERTKREQREEGQVEKEHVLAEFVRQTGLPELFLRDEVALSRQEIIEYFQGEILGQTEAIETTATLVLTFKSGMNDPNRPVGAFLFCGPTGVGKTALARTMSRYFFEHGDEENRLIRLDMSEYSGPGAAERLLSQADGRPSELIRRIRQQPFVVLLLDEIEKADAQVFDVLLNVLDEGRLTDRYGRLTTFRSAIIIMTSNLGAGRQQPFGFSSQPSVQYEGEALAFFRPEFFNRLDGVVTFHSLDQETIQGITKKELSEIEKREGLTRLGIKLNWSEAVIEHLAEVGFDERFGARPLQRAIETRIVTPLARYLLEHPEIHEQAIRVALNEHHHITFTASKDNPQ